MLYNSQCVTPYAVHDTPTKTKKFPKVNQVPVKYHRKMTNIIKKHASLNNIVPILAKSLSYIATVP